MMMVWIQSNLTSSYPKQTPYFPQNKLKSYWTSNHQDQLKLRLLAEVRPQLTEVNFLINLETSA